jgi:hypothetical protein
MPPTRKWGTAAGSVRVPSITAARICLARRVAIGATTAGWLLAGLGGQAYAGSYDVWSCRTPQGAPAPVGDATAGWQPRTSGHAFMANSNTCAGGGYFQSRLAGQAPYGAFADWLFIAPPSTSITSFEVYWAGAAQSDASGWAADAFVGRSDQTDPAYEKRYYGSGAIGDLTTPLAAVNRVDNSGLDLSWLRVGIGCSPFSGGGPYNGCPNPGAGETGFVRMYRSRVSLGDASSPNVGTVSGDITTRAELSGNTSATFNASDTGSGVYRLILNVDNADTLATVIDANGGRCADVDPTNVRNDFSWPRPCATSTSGDVSLDTRALSDGVHTLRLKVEDAAGNRSTVYGPTTKVIRNTTASPDTNPAQPGTNPPAAGPGQTTQPGAGQKGPGDPNGVGASEKAVVSVNGQRTRTVAYGRRIATVGTLVDESGRPIRNASVTVENRDFVPGVGVPRGATWKRADVVATDANGRFRYMIPAKASRTVRFGYKAFSGSKDLTSMSDVTLLVGAKATLKVDRRSVRNGQRVKFSGTVLSKPIPATGVIIDLQARVPGRGWVTFKVTRAKRNGRFAASYRFTATTVKRTYTFRARVRRDSSYAYGAAISKTAKVGVRP